jgi:hypothetical protein
VWKSKATDLLTLVMVVALLYLLVRPKSNSIAFVKAFSEAMTALVSAAADFG